MRYGLNDKPKATDFILFALQWFAVILPSLIILAGVVSGLETDDAQLKMIYTQKVFIITGIALIVQVLYGHKLPIVIGPATILLIGMLGSRTSSFGAAYTASAIGGAMVVLFSFGRFFKYIQKIFTTRVIVVILMLVALTILPLIIEQSMGVNGNYFFNAGFAILLVVIMIIANLRAKGVMKSVVIILGLVLGSVLYLLAQGTPSDIVAAKMDWRLFANKFFIKPEFDLGTIISFIFCFLAVMVNEFGAIQATGQFINADDMMGRSKRGLRTSGIANIFAGTMGTIGLVNYSMSPGVIASTQSSTRYPLILTGAFMLVCVVFPQIFNLMAYIPSVVIGAMLLYIMTTQLSSGFLMVGGKKVVEDFRSAVIVSFPIMLAIFISFVPDEFVNSVPELFRAIIGNGFVMGTMAVLLLEHTLPKSRV